MIGRRPPRQAPPVSASARTGTVREPPTRAFILAGDEIFPADGTETLPDDPALPVVHYSDTGSGEPLVLVHGLSAGFQTWEPQIDCFSRSYRVIAVNVRGVGKSGKIAGWSHILDQQVDDVALLLERLGIGSAVLCGVSYGGVLVQKFYLSHPEKCRALAILDSYSTTRPRGLKDLAWLASVYLGAPANLLPRRWLASLMGRVYRQWPTARRIMSDAMGGYRGLEAMKTRLAINHVDFVPRLSEVSVPVFCAVGTCSWWRSGEFMRRCSEAIPTCQELVCIADAYDPSNLCQPDVFNQELSWFLRDVAG